MIDRIGKYEIRGELGKGGFGQVYLAFDPTVGRLVAIKVLSAGGDSSLLIRFRTEATAAGNLRHKNIVTVYDFGEDRGTFYLVMEYLDGKDLQHVIAAPGSYTLIDKIRIMWQVAEGLHCAHQGGVVHRDIKPANIMLLHDGSVKIMDFGIARLTSESSARLTQTGFMIGTITYMAPEQLRGGEADVLCDVWAYGTIFYELLTGRNPFHAPDPASAMFRITSVDPGGVSAQCPGCPEGLENVVSRLLAKDRDSRYQTLEDVLFDMSPVLLELEKAQSGQLIIQAKNLINEEKLDEAQRLVRKILELEPMHREARALREDLQTELKRRSTHSRIEALRLKAEQAAGENEFGEAIQAISSALQIRPSDTALKNRLQELEAAQEQRRRAKILVAQAQNELDLQKFTSAFKSATDALAAEPNNSEAKELITRIERMVAARDAERLLKEGIGKIKGLLVVDALDEALDLLQDLAKRAPEHPEVRELLARTDRQRQERERRIQIQSQLDAAKASIKNEDFANACARLEQLSREYPNEQSIAEMLAYAREQLQATERLAEVKALGNQAWALLKADNFDGALAVTSEGLAAHPDNERLLRLREVIRSGRAEHIRKVAVRKALDEAALLERANRREDAIAVLDAALREQPDHPELQAAREEARRKIADMERQKRADAIKDALNRARNMVEGGKVDSAKELLQDATSIYPNEPELTSLLNWAQAEEKRQRRQKGVGQVLSSAAELEKQGELVAAQKLVEEGMLSYTSSTELADAAARLRIRAGIQQDLAAITQKVARKEFATALTLIAGARQRYPQEHSLRELEEKALAEQRQTAIEALCSDAQRQFHALDLDGAKETLLRGRQDFGPEPSLVDLEAEVTRALDRRQNLESARQLTKKQNWAGAEAALRVILNRDSSDAEARALFVSMVKERDKEQHWQKREKQRKQAQRAVEAGRFDEAESSLRGLLADFPDDAVLLEDLRLVMEARDQSQRRERIRVARDSTNRLLRELRFDAAIAGLQNLQAEFPGDAAVDRELAAAVAAKQTHERQQLSEQARGKVAEMLSRREFDKAIRALQLLLERFPGDPAIEEDLKSAIGAKELAAKRKLLDQQVQHLEGLFRSGDPHGVKEQARLLAPGVQDPRVRELVEWADKEIARTAQEKAGALQQRNRRRMAIAAGATAGVCIAGLLIWTLRPSGGPAALTASPAELSFTMTAGATSPVSKTISLKSRDAQAWVSSVTDDWITVEPSRGNTPASVVVSVAPGRLDRGSYSALVTFETVNDASAKVSVRVKAVVEAAASTIPIETGRTLPEVKPVDPKTSVNTNKNTVTTPEVRTPVTTNPTNKTPATTDPPVIPTPPVEDKNPVVPVKAKPPPPPIVDCHAPDYRGLHKGTLRWVNGSLEPNATLVLRATGEFLAGGRVTGTSLPGCDVSITSETSGIEIVEKPSRETGFRQVKVQNKSGIAVSNVVLQWRDK